MNTRSFLIAMLLALCLITGVQAQTNNTETKDDQTNLDTQLYLIVGTNQDVVESKLPASLDSIIKQLRATLPFKNYRLAATLLNRVKSDSRVELNWIGGPLASPTSSQNPSFSYFKVRQVRLIRDSAGQPMVHLHDFNFGARIPIQTGGTIAATGAVAPIINYESTGLATDISMREGEPVIVGTLNVGPSGDAIILIVSAKRTQK